MTHTPLTVEQLIDKLRSFPSDAMVMIHCDDDYYTGALCAEDVQLGTALQFEGYDNWHIDDLGLYSQIVKTRRQCVKFWAEVDR